MENFTSIHFFNNGFAQIVYGKDSNMIEVSSIQEVQNLSDHIKSFSPNAGQMSENIMCHIVNGKHAVYLGETESGEDASYEVVWKEIDIKILEDAVLAMMPAE
jgi:hypothetical protein